MAEEIFVDSGAWVAIANKGDTFHSVAINIYPQVLMKYRHLMTTNFVVAEAHVIIRNELGHRAAIDFLEGIRASPRIERVMSALDLEAEAEKILRKYDDQDFSYTDAVSFALMKARRIREAFAFDKHFSAMGFLCVPASVRS